MEMMESLSYFVTFPTVHTASVRCLNILGYFYWLVSLVFHFRLRMYGKNALLNFSSKLHANLHANYYCCSSWNNAFQLFFMVTHI